MPLPDRFNLLPDSPPRRFARLHRHVERIPPFQPKVRLRAPLPDPGGKTVGPEPVLHRIAGEQPRGGVHASAPEVARRARDDPGVVTAHLESEGEAAVEGEVGEHPLAETVDGEDVGPIDVLEGRFEAPDRGLRSEPGIFPPAGKELRRLGAFRYLPGHHPPMGGPEGLPDPVAELGGRRPGERHHQDLVEPPVALHHEPGDDAGELPGLARTRARFDEGHAACAADEPLPGHSGDDRRAHCSASARGTRRLTANSSKSSVSGSRSSWTSCR